MTKWIYKEELGSHIYGDVVDEITRLDETLVYEALDTAMEEAAGYLRTRYDMEAVYSTADDKRPALLMHRIKDLATWHLISLANPNIDIELREKRYLDAIKWLKDAQKGIVTLSLPLLTDDDPSDGVGIEISWSSNPKRNNHF